MEKRNVKKGGFTLIETLVTLLILVILVVGMDTAMNAAVRVHDEAVFQSDSASLAGMLNVTMSDLFCYVNVEKTEVLPEGAQSERGDTPGVVYVNSDFGVGRGYLMVDPTQNAILRFQSFDSLNYRDLINGGAFGDTGADGQPKMRIDDFRVDYADETFTVSYVIRSNQNERFERSVTNTFRPLNTNP